MSKMLKQIDNGEAINFRELRKNNEFKEFYAQFVGYIKKNNKK
jgi:hypothetical protein